MTLDLQAVSGGYGSDPVVRGVDLSVGRGEIVSVLGPSGSGKTTLLRLIAGLHPVASGRVVSGGRDLTDVPAHRRRIGLVAQEGALFPGLSVAANVASTAAAACAPGGRRTTPTCGDCSRSCTWTTSRIGCRTNCRAVSASGLRWARALAPRPTVVLLDEPFNALDAGLRTGVREGVLTLLREAGVAGLLITHDRAEAFASGDRVAVFADGRVAQVDTPRRPLPRAGYSRRRCADGDVIAVPTRWVDGPVSRCVRNSWSSIPRRCARTCHDHARRGARAVITVAFADGGNRGRGGVGPRAVTRRRHRGRGRGTGEHPAAADGLTGRGPARVLTFPCPPGVTTGRQWGHGTLRTATGGTERVGGPAGEPARPRTTAELLPDDDRPAASPTGLLGLCRRRDDHDRDPAGRRRPLRPTPTEHPEADDTAPPPRGHHAAG